MAAFGRLQAALAAATNEVTVAAANINFDFTLVKYEAPKEFRPIEGFLTTTRKQDAEAGRAHIVARRLGALFDGVCPETPNLIKAYGARVSEISKAATQKESQEYSKSIFASYVGVDATSIWAAATSSKTAIHVHLLACMLAELWEAPEATSIWVELVAERRKDIAQRLEQGEALHFGLASAAVQQEITRDQLAAWDASARAWIQTGRSVMKKNDTQLKLILQNVCFAINPSEAPFVSVIDAWKLALETTEKLILGIPQEAQNGAAVLGLSAWHIYPDIHVYGDKNVQVTMNDELVADGGTLTLASRPSHRNDQQGVYWSLCLSHLKFYGPPVKRKQTMNKDPRRISFDNLLQAAVGALLSRWKIPSSNLTDDMELLITTLDTISVGNPSLMGPMSLISNVIRECLSDDEAMKYLSTKAKRRKKMPEEAAYRDFIVSGTRIHRGEGINKAILDFWLGDPSSTAIFGDRIDDPRSSIGTTTVTSDDLKWCFDNSIISAQRLVKLLDDRDPVLLTIANLYYASTVFNTLPRSFVRIQTLENPLLDAHWAQEDRFTIDSGAITYRYPFRLDHSRKFYDIERFQILAHLMCGYNIPRSAIPSHVMGLSFEDSIYVPTTLVHDPGVQTTHLTQILGNVGRPGLVILVPPAEPMLAPLEEGTWRISNLNHFDGKREDMLSATSLHLSFTNWSQPLGSAETSGSQDVGGSIIEAVISIKDSGQWIGDVDVLKALESDMIHLVQSNPDCSHELDLLPQKSMQSIECWDELRDCPEEQAVIRAGGNWVARLAATSYLAQKMEQNGMRSSRIFICPEGVCWTCQGSGDMDDLFIY
ncbi:hypothetical protein F53441_9345 [Fusarium austroafricanum]|uniref:Uncharacterized protein n=1 Tax=Fusarium austroafricanum TaxID=2364996 RepID=A0A8H4NWE9_9HYPO|nr:hypothetical protein F53441_9345 [Fusarium austroafricanum]